MELRYQIEISEGAIDSKVIGAPEGLIDIRVDFGQQSFDILRNGISIGIEFFIKSKHRLLIFFIEHFFFITLMDCFFDPIR